MSVRYTHVSQRSEFSPSQGFDLAIGFVGPDPRSIRNLHDAFPRATHCWAIPSQQCLDDERTGSPEHLRIRANLKSLGEISVKSWDKQILSELSDLLDSGRATNDSYRLFIDVSAFPRRFLACLLDAVRASVINGRSIQLTLGYRLALFSKPRDEEAPPNRRVAPVHRSMAGWPRLPGLPVHLIAGLGYERGKALGAVEYIQPAKLSLFTPQSPEPRFAEQVNERNSGLLEGTSREAIYAYQVMDPAAQFAQLSSMLSSMLIDSKPVLLPFGPKIFFAVCILISFIYPEISVWHVSGEEDETTGLVKPSEHVVYADFSLCSPAGGEGLDA